MNNTGTGDVPRKTSHAQFHRPAQAIHKPGSHQPALAYNPAPGDLVRLETRLGQGDPISAPAGDNRRCGEKGCVFPAAQRTMGVCLHHHRQRREPAFYHSLQPTGLLMDAVKFGLPNTPRDRSRLEDRHRLAAIREQFLEELA